MESVQKFSDKHSSAQILIVNINIVSTGVNIHQTCSKGILVTFYFNEKTLQLVHSGLNLLG